MKIYLLSLGTGLLVGVIYSLLGVRSPAPPVVALVGLLGILIGEQLVPVAKRLLGPPPVTTAASASQPSAEPSVQQPPAKSEPGEPQ